MATSSDPADIPFNPPIGKDIDAAAGYQEKKSFKELLEAAPEKYNSFISSLPRYEAMQVPLRLYNGFYMLEISLPHVMTVQDHFQAHPNDLILATQPKSGTTWLKALAFAVANRHVCALGPHHPLLSNNPHQCVPFLEVPMGLDVEKYIYGDGAGHDSRGSRRILATHLPYSLLPASVRESECRLIFLARDPKDVFVSYWHFWRKNNAANEAAMDMKQAFESFVAGTFGYGPILDQYLEYWKESKRAPDKVLFLKYEDMIADAAGSVRRMAEFMGVPYTEEEDRNGVVEEVVKLCSLENMKGLEVNRNDALKAFGKFSLRHDTFFREGKVGDWVNHLSSEMADKIDEICNQKLQGSGLNFQT